MVFIVSGNEFTLATIMAQQGVKTRNNYKIPSIRIIMYNEYCFENVQELRGIMIRRQVLHDFLFLNAWCRRLLIHTLIISTNKHGKTIILYISKNTTTPCGWEKVHYEMQGFLKLFYVYLFYIFVAFFSFFFFLPQRAYYVVRIVI